MSNEKKQTVRLRTVRRIHRAARRRGETIDSLKTWARTRGSFKLRKNQVPTAALAGVLGK